MHIMIYINIAGCIYNDVIKKTLDLLIATNLNK